MPRVLLFPRQKDACATCKSCRFTMGCSNELMFYRRSAIEKFTQKTREKHAFCRSKAVSLPAIFVNCQWFVYNNNLKLRDFNSGLIDTLCSSQRLNWSP